jgi:D-apionolactonase
VIEEGATMHTISQQLVLRGSEEPAQELVSLRAGPLIAALDGVDLRYVRLGGVELVRRIYAAVRDQNWNTIAGVAADRQIEACEDKFEVRFEVRHANDELDFSWRGMITGTPDGRIVFSLDGEAGRDFPYNRIGFCVLHPWRETAGAHYRGETPDGPVEGRFPVSIGRQDFVDGLYISLFPAVSRLEIDVADDTTAVFEFEGDLFECEDQRNWSDASFKTYCTPLVEGLPHRAAAGLQIAQAVAVSVRGRARDVQREESTRLTLGPATGAHVLSIGLGLPEGPPKLSEREIELLRALGPAHLRLELHLNQPWWPEELARGAESLRQLGAALELTLFLGEQQASELARLAEALARIDLARVLVAPEGARSATPDETTPPELVRLVREGLGLTGVPVAGGTDMYFCEVNRTRPEMSAMDGLFWSVNPQVHAFDDVSLVETPEAQGEQVRTALEITGGKPAFVSPITLKRRYNVNATVAEAERPGDELPDPVDPRQASLLGAVWTAASLKYLVETGASAATYYETTGWRGVIQGDEPPPLPEQFPGRAGETFPLYHVLADVAGWRGSEVLSCESTSPLRLVGLAVRGREGTHLLVANLTPEAVNATVSGLAGAVFLRRLNVPSAKQALFDAERFRATREPVPAADELRLALEPYETVRIDA